MHDGEQQHEATPTERRSSLNAFSTPSTSWQLDDFVFEPEYVESREELRYLMLRTAQTAPSSPIHESSFITVQDLHESEDQLSARHRISHLLSKGRRIEYLKNYISEVAPWVRSSLVSSDVTVLIKG